MMVSSRAAAVWLVASIGCLCHAAYIGPYKMTFSSAEPEKAQEFVIKYLGATFIQQPFPDANGHCAMIKWVEFRSNVSYELPKSKEFPEGKSDVYSIHFVKGYNYRNGSMTIDEFEGQMAALHGKMSRYDEFMNFHTSFATADLDPIAAALHNDGVPMLVKQNSDGMYSLFVEAPRAIIFEIVAPKLSVLKVPASSGRCNAPSRPASVDEVAIEKIKALGAPLPPVWPLRAEYASTKPAEAAQYVATYLQGKVMAPEINSCGNVYKVRWESPIGLPYEMWWTHTPELKRKHYGTLSLRDYEKYLVALHRNISNVSYDEYMDFHIGMWYDDGDSFIAQLDADKREYFLKGQAKNHDPDFFVEDGMGQIYEMQSVTQLKTKVPLPEFDLCQKTNMTSVGDAESRLHDIIV